MRIVDALRSREQLADILDPNHPRLRSGTPEEMRQALREHQAAKLEQAIIALKEELPRSELDFSGRHWIEHVPTGRFFTTFGGDPAYSPGVDHFYFTESGHPLMLEPADPPSRAELERRQAAKEQRRLDREAAAKERRTLALREATQR